MSDPTATAGSPERRSTPTTAATERDTPTVRLRSIVDLLDRYDESCEDDLCECCGMWRSLVSDVRREAEGD